MLWAEIFEVNFGTKIQEFLEVKLKMQLSLT